LPAKFIINVPRIPAINVTFLFFESVATMVELNENACVRLKAKIVARIRL
jgi:hypothetical protein